MRFIKFACFFLSLCTFCHLLFVCSAYIGHHTSLFFFKFSKASARARHRNEGVSSPVSCLQSRAWSFACLGRFTRQTKKQERLLVDKKVTGTLRNRPQWVVKRINTIAHWKIGFGPKNIMRPFRWVKYSPIFESNLAPCNTGQLPRSDLNTKAGSGSQCGLK